jgi:hypothetical protein
LRSDLSSEIVARVSDVDAEESRAMSAEASINVAASTSMSTEVAARTSADASLTTSVSNQMSTEVAARTSADASLNSGLSTEIVARTSADTSLTTRVSTETSRATSAEASLSTLLSGQVSSEAVVRVSGDTSLQTQIDSLPFTDNATVEVASNNLRLKDSVGAASGGTRTWAGLQNAAVQPDTLAGFGDLTYITKAYASVQMSTEVATRTSADTSLSTRVSTEVSRATSAEASLASSVSSQMSTEVAARTSADTSLTTSVSTERNRIDAILSASTFSADSFAEIVTLINSVDTTNDESFAGYVLSNNAALSTELVARASADTSLATLLSGDMSTELAARTSADASLASNLSSEISRAESVESSLGSALSTALSSNIYAEESRAMSAEASLDSALSAEISRATSIEGTLDVKISDIISNTDLTQVDSFVETIDQFNSMIETNFDSIYAKKNTSSQAPNGTATVFPLVNAVKVGSEQVYLNGLMLDAGDYTTTVVSSEVTEITFNLAPDSGDKVVFYGVYGSFTNVDFQ